VTITVRGLRKIVVDGHSYVWRVRKTKCPCCHSRAVVIADASRRGSVVHLPGPDALGAVQVAITPALIAIRIREARALGWRPAEGAGVFAVLRGAGK
jgi:hypothetical protein